MTVLSNAMKNLPELTANVAKYSDELIAEAKNVNNDMEKFGEFIGHLIQKATQTDGVKSTTLAQVEVPDNAYMVVAEIAQGFYQATKVGDFNFTALLDCIYWADQDAIVIYETMKEIIKHWKTFDFVDLYIVACGAAVLYGQFQQTMYYCKAVDPQQYDWTHLNKITTIAKNKDYKTAGKNFIFHGVDITSDFMQAMKAAEVKDYKNFGYLLGNALMLATQAEDNNLFLY